MTGTAEARDQAAHDAPAPPPGGWLSFTLHAHLPYVVNHGTWPHGMEWLHEAAAETYLPLLRVLTRLDRDGIALHCNLNLSPVLMEQLTHPVFLAEFPQYLTRKIVAAREDEAFFIQSGEAQYVETARFWQRFFTEALDDFRALSGNIVAAFRGFHERGLIEIITSAATHGYLPLLGTDASVRAQVRTAVQTFTRHIGAPPNGIWAPECGYRPAGPWTFPVTNPDGSALAPAANRIGVEQAFAESHLRYFFVDTHLVEDSQPHSPYGPNSRPTRHRTPAATPHSLYQPYCVQGPYDPTNTPSKAVAIFPRDPRTGLQVWSGELGYPGEADYLDFHKKRWPGGHRYWRVTGGHVDMADKHPYNPAHAHHHIESHAAHFVALVEQALQTSPAPSAPILSSPFDAELFGHWWFEGPLWLEAVARRIHAHPRLQLTTASAYLAEHPPTQFLALEEGSWGADGDNHVWLNPETSWTYTHLYPAEIFVRDLANAGQFRTSSLALRIARQLCRELLLLESSDWQFLITTGAARDYAELRFLTHNDQFHEVKQMWQAYLAAQSLNEHQQCRLEALEQRDGIFPDLDPAAWADPAPNP